MAAEAVEAVAEQARTTDELAAEEAELAAAATRAGDESDERPEPAVNTSVAAEEAAVDTPDVLGRPG